MNGNGAVALVGISPEAVRAFVAENAGKLFEPSAEERASEGAAAREQRFEELSTAQVVSRVIKPATASSRCSYAQLLQSRVRACALHEAGAARAAAGALPKPLATLPSARRTRATPLAGHTWNAPRCSCRTRGTTRSATWLRRWKRGSATPPRRATRASAARRLQRALLTRPAPTRGTYTSG